MDIHIDKIYNNRNLTSTLKVAKRLHAYSMHVEQSMHERQKV